MEGQTKLTVDRIVALVLLVGGAGYAYLRFVEPRLEAREHSDLMPYAALQATGEPLASNEKGFRRGRVLILVPAREVTSAKQRRVLPPKLHPAWYQLPRGLRARKPTDVRTVIQVVHRRIEPTGAELGEQSDAAAAVVVLDLVVFDWHKRRWVSTHTLEPGRAEDEAALVATFVEAMPEPQ